MSDAFCNNEKANIENLIKPVDYEVFLPPEFGSDPKKYQKPLGFSLKMTRWEKAFRIVEMEWEFPGQMIILMIMGKVTPKSEKTL